MAVRREDVTLDGEQFWRYSSDKLVKVQCRNDGNVFSVAYVPKGSTLQFTETDRPVTEAVSGAIIDLSSIPALKEYILKTIEEEIDGTRDGSLEIDQGGAGG